MLLKTFLLPILFLSSWLSFGETLISVDRAFFQKGSSWEWLYSQWDQELKEWTPYYTEKYEVKEVQGHLIVIEMSSSPGLSHPSEPHHRFVIDFRKCERAAKNPRYKDFQVALYSKSLSGEWELISHNHDHLVFTEKFNCVQPLSDQSVISREHIFDGVSYRTSQILSNPPKSSSWYFADHSDLNGVMAFKLMGSLGQYKIEFLK